jgi:hypothetical protein
MHTNLLARVLAVSLAGLAGLAQAAPLTKTSTFSNGDDGWSVVAGFVDATSGNAAPALRTQIVDTFWLTFSNTSTAGFVGDYTRANQMSFGIDVRVNSITYEGHEVPRHLIVELRDHGQPENGFPYTSVWFDLGVIKSADAGFQHLSAAIPDTHATVLPRGWQGYGAEDAFGNPKLPDDRTFTSVLARVDEVVFSTYVPGYFYGFTSFDVVVDNLSVTGRCQRHPAAGASGASDASDVSKGEAALRHCRT